MATSESVVAQFDREFGIKRLTAYDNTGLIVNSNNYSKKTKQVVLEQQRKSMSKVRRGLRNEQSTL